MATQPHRYLVARLWYQQGGTLALLRFPPGVILQDAADGGPGGPWLDWPWAGIPSRALDHLAALGVDVAATGDYGTIRAEMDRLCRAASLEPFLRDYLDANASRARDRCVAAGEYLMDTALDGHPMAAAAIEALGRAPGVVSCPLPYISSLHMPDTFSRRFPDAIALRWSDAPPAAGLRAAHLIVAADHVISPMPLASAIPCSLHRRNCPIDAPWWPVRDIAAALDSAAWGARVPMAAREIEALALRRPWAAQAALRHLLAAVPPGSWAGACPRAFAHAVAYAWSRTCEEYAMLSRALQACGSCQEVVERLRDPGWAVARALEGLHA